MYLIEFLIKFDTKFDDRNNTLSYIDFYFREWKKKKEKNSHIDYIYIHTYRLTLVHIIICKQTDRHREKQTITMRSTGYGGLIDCSWYDIENYLQQSESDFQRMGKLGGG